MLNRARVVNERRFADLQSRRPSIKISSDFFIRGEFADHLRESCLLGVAVEVLRNLYNDFHSDRVSQAVSGMSGMTSDPSGFVDPPDQSRGRGSDANR